MSNEFEKLAYEVAVRGLDKQEGLLEELRARTGLPKKNLIFAEAGTGLYEKIRWLTRSYTVAAAALVIEILSLAALLGDNIV